MQIVLFYHSLISDWNHGNAHFLRGIVSELLRRGHQVLVYEPKDGWSRRHLLAQEGPGAVSALYRSYPQLRGVSRDYELGTLDLDRVLDGADLVIVHEWNEPELVAAVGRKRRHGRFRLYFHDTHHRAVSAPAAMAAYDLRDYDGVLAFGESLRSVYLENDWAHQVWTWHEAADTALFRPHAQERRPGLVWIGNWGDGERARELQTYLLEPARRLELGATVYGVRYPDHAFEALARARAVYRGWLPNHAVPDVFSRYAVTVHVPRGPYARALPGIPTIRPFEALACGIPLLCAPWNDCEGLFRCGTDYLAARDGKAMTRLLRDVLEDRELAQSLARNGRQRIEERHTCRHRVDELLALDAGQSARASRLHSAGQALATAGGQAS